MAKLFTKGGDKMKVLFNISNHPSKTWMDEQKKGWDIIFDVPFPEVFPDSNLNELVQAVLDEVYAKTCEAAIPSEAVVCVMIKGDYGLAFKLYEAMKGYYKIVHPVSVKNSKDEVQPDGSVKKTIIYKFVKWVEL
jgi:hypothetical protein